MGRFAKEPQGGDFERAPEGTHLGVCYRIYDLGTQHKEFDGEERVANEVMICWELPGELMADGRPFGVSGFYTNSLHEKAKLRAHLVAWRGRDFTAAELERFDLANILGAACFLNVGYNKAGREKVNSVVALPKGFDVPKPINEVFAFFLDEWDDAVFAKIPEGIQNLIKKSDEYKAMQVEGEPLPPDGEKVPF